MARLASTTFFLAVLTGLCAAPPALAQPVEAEEESDDEARWRFQRARVDFDAGRYREALENFERAYELSGHAELLFNIGQCMVRLAMDERAIEAFEGYLRESPEAENRPEVEMRIRELRARIAAQGTVEPDPDPDPGPGVEEEEDGGGGILTKWWFWTIVGGVVLAGTVVAIAVAASSGGGPEPVGGNLGEVFEVLTWR